MSSSKLKYPPDDSFNLPFGNKYEYIILWMVNNNPSCEWSDFTLKIRESTLSGHLKRLLSKGFIEKPKRNQYQITDEGKNRFNDLNYYRKSGRRKLNYPPEVLLKKRNYDHWILWMVNNNDSCKWSDFRADPLKINQSSLSKNLNLLTDDRFIINENKEYKITQAGKSEYFKILRQYDLDRQSILEEESKRIEEITEKTSKFFEKYEIVDSEIKFRFINNILKLDYEKSEEFVVEEDFKKILLFFAINHPNQYPEYTSPEEFSSTYDIKRTTLDFFIEKIVEESFYPIKFFKLKADDNKVYYFQANERLERIFNAIVEDYITKYTYLNKFHRKTTNENFAFDIEQILDNVLNYICCNLFHEDLKDPLREFIPEYINYLAYKIETERELVGSVDKFKGVAFQNVSNWFQAFYTSGVHGHNGEDIIYYYLDPTIFRALEIFYLTKQDFFASTEFRKVYFEPKNQKYLEKFEKLLVQGKISKARNLIDENISSFNELEKEILKDLLISSQKNIDESLKITGRIIEKHPEEPVGYLFQSLTYFEMNELEKALDLVEMGLNIKPDIYLTCLKVQILVKKYNTRKVLQILDDALSENPNNFFLLRSKSIALLTRMKIYPFSSYVEPLNIIDAAIKLNPANLELKVLKAIILCVMQRHKQAKRLMYKEIDFNPFNKNIRINTAAYFILAFSYLARGKFQKALDICHQVLLHYSQHPISYLTKALVLGYNIIYKFTEESNVDAFLGMLDMTISVDSNLSHQSRFNQLKCHIFQEMERNEEALIAIEDGIVLNPEDFSLYNNKINILITAKKFEDALELISKLEEKFPYMEREIMAYKSYIYYFMGDFFNALKVLEGVRDFKPENATLINNKALLLAEIALVLEREGKKEEANRNKEEAIKTAEKLLEINPNEGNFHDSVGEIFMLFKDYEAAIKEFEHALKLEPYGCFTFQTIIKMGNCYKELGNYDKAMELFERGKVFTERMLPGDRELYSYKADEYLEEIKKLKQ